MSLGNLSTEAVVSAGANLPEYTDGTRNWPVGLAGYVVATGSPDTLQAVDPTHGLPVQPQTGSTWAVTGTFWQATQPVSGPLTDTQLRATAVPVSDGGGSLTVDGTVSVSGVGGQVEVTGIGGSAVVVQGAIPHNTDATVAAPFLASAYASTAAPAAVSTDGNAVRLWADRNGRLQVGDGGGSLTVDGSVSASVSSLPGTTNAGATARTADYDTGAGTDTVTMFGIALPKSGGAVPGGTSSDPIRVDPTGTTTQPVSGSVSVSGSVTPGTGAANLGKAEDAAAADGDVGVFVLSVRQDAPAGSTSADGDYQAIKTDSLGRMWTHIGAIDAGTITTVSTVTSLSQFAGNAIDTNSGVKGAGTLRVVLATDQPQLTNKLLVTPDANSTVDLNKVAGTATATGNGTASAGCQRVTIASDNTAFPVNATLQTGSNLAGRVNPEPQTANGLSVSRTLSAASTNGTSVKASAGQVYSVYCHNTNASPRFLKLYNKASAPTVGTDTPVLTLPIPGNAAGAGFVLDTGGMGIAFGTGIALAITTGVADADTGAVAANEVVVNLLYK
jgi:hypothetical protein